MKNNKISEFLQTRIDAGDFPSAVYLVAEKGEIVFQDALGYAVVEPERIGARIDTIYDLASLTKPLITGLLCACLIEHERLELDRDLEYYLPELIEFRTAHDPPEIAGYDCLDVFVSELLTHHSRYQAWKPFYLLCDKDAREIRHEVLCLIANRIPAQLSPEVIYSDLNFIMLGGLIEKLYAKKLDSAADDEIFQPLKLINTFFNPPGNVRSRIAASEKGNEYEKQTCIEQGYLQPPTAAGGTDTAARNPDFFRDYQIWGEVHDGNAWFLGGVAGHAGLFSTAEEVFKIALQFLPNYTTLLKPETTVLFRTNSTKGMNEARSIGFQLAETPESTAGSRMSPQSFGHLGFTGTSLWIDPVKERIFILLTNRTHAHPLPFVNINSVRRRFHDLANDLLDTQQSG